MLILFGASLVHFMYESVIAPTIRLKLRFRLFELRDELRQLKIDAPKSVSDEVFEMVQQNLNAGIRLLPKTDFVLLRAFSDAMKADPELRMDVERRATLVERCMSPELRRIRKDASKVFFLAFATNTAFMLLLAVPILLALFPGSLLKRSIDNLLSVPAERADEFDVERYVATV